MTPAEAIAFAYTVVLGGLLAYVWRLRVRVRAAEAALRGAVAAEPPGSPATLVPPGVSHTGSP